MGLNCRSVQIFDIFSLWIEKCEKFANFYWSIFLFANFYWSILTIAWAENIARWFCLSPCHEIIILADK